MATALRPIAHDDRLSLVEHLDELRTRILICLGVFIAAAAFCWWQNDTVLEIMDRPLEKSAFQKGSEDAFELPAFSPREREVALPLMALVPFLFIAGVLFAYYLVLPAAINFLQNFNDDNFDILLQARDYYRFSLMVLIAMGVLFQVLIGVLAVTRVGIVTPR